MRASPGHRVVRSSLPIVAFGMLLVLSTGVGLLAGGPGPAGSIPTASGPSAVPGVRTMAASITISPTSGSATTQVSVSGSGFPCNNCSYGNTITISFNGTSISTSPTPCTASTSGSFGPCDFRVPSGPVGNVPVGAQGGGFTASTTFTETRNLTVSPGSADVGQSIEVAATGFGSSVQISTFTLGSRSVACTSATVGSCSTGGVVSTDASGAFNATIPVPSVPSAGTYVLHAVDSAGTSENGQVVVSPDPTVSGISTTPSGPADINETVVFQVTVQLGSGGDRYQWTGLPGCPSESSATLSCRIGAAGSTNVQVTVTDSNQYSVTSGPLAFQSDPMPTVTTPTAVAGSNRSGPVVSSVDIGQEVTFATTAALGSGSYASFAWSGLPAGCAGSTEVLHCSPTAPSSGPITVLVTDTNGGNSTASGALDFVVAPDPTATALTPSASSADVGQSITFRLASGPGAGGDTYSWAGLPPGCTGATIAPTASCTLTASGNFSITATVTDANGGSATSPHVRFVVAPALVVSLVAPSATLDVGMTFRATVSATGGAGGYVPAWTGLPAGCEPTGNSVTCVLLSPGPATVDANVTDLNRNVVVAAPLHLQVGPQITVSIQTATVNPATGSTAAFTATASGGTGARIDAWSFGDGVHAEGARVEHAFAASGLYLVTVWVNDSVGGSGSANVAMTVGPAAAGPFATTLSAELAGSAAGGAGLVLAAVFLHGRRRGRTPPRGSSSGTGTGANVLPMSTEPPAAGDGPETSGAGGGPSSRIRSWATGPAS